TRPAPAESRVAPTPSAAQVSTPPYRVPIPARQTPPPTLVAWPSIPPAVAVGPEAPVTARPAKRRLSLRLVLLGLAGLVVVALASGIVWLTLHEAAPGGVTLRHATPAGVITEFPIPTPQSRSEGI